MKLIILYNSTIIYSNRALVLAFGNIKIYDYNPISVEKKPIWLHCQEDINT